MNIWKRSARRWRGAGLVAALALVTMACGDDSGAGEGGGEDAAAGGPDETATVTVSATSAPDGDTVETSTDHGGSDLIDAAEELTELSRRELVYTPVTTPTNADDFEPYGDWRGPASAPAPTSDVNVQVITCSSAATGCQSGAEGALEAVEALGWTAELIDGGGDPQGWASAFNTALQRGPDAIVAIGTPTIAVADSVAEARSRGVLTVVVADVEPDGGEAFDGYVPYPTDAIWALGAWNAIADADGAARQIVPQETDYPVFVDAVSNYREVVEGCSECTIEVVDWQLAESMDPKRVDEVVGGALSRTSDVNGIFVSVGHVVPALAAMIGESGDDDLHIGVSVADPTAIELVATGAADYTVGTPPSWAGWAAIDQVIRGLAGEAFLTPTEIGFGIGALTTETAPPSGDFDEWPGTVDYRAEYRAIWGLD